MELCQKNLSLKKLLYQEIQIRGICSLDILYTITEREKHKHETMARKCRELQEEGRIKALRNEHGWITGYRYANEIWEQIKLF